MAVFNLPPIPPNVDQPFILKQWLFEVVKKIVTLVDTAATAADSSLLESNDSDYHLARANHTGTEANAAITEGSVTQHEAALSITESQITDLSTNKATTAQLVDNTNAINTDAAKVLGFAVLNTTTGVLVFASGNGDSDTWDFYDATTAHTPV